MLITLILTLAKQVGGIKPKKKKKKPINLQEFYCVSVCIGGIAGGFLVAGVSAKPMSFRLRRSYKSFFSLF